MLDMLFPENFSHSSLESLSRCQVFWFRSYCQRFETESTPDLIAGRLFATACELARKGFYLDDLPLDKAIALGYDSIRLGEDTGDNLKTNEYMATLFKRYFTKYPLDKSWTPVKLQNGQYAIEFKYKFDLGIPHPDMSDKNICLVGKLDMLGERMLPGMIRKVSPIDEKTTKSVKRVKGTTIVDIAAEEKVLATSGQMAQYAWAVNILGEEATDAYIRRIPILKDYEPSFEVHINLPTFMMESWVDSTMNKIHDIVERYKHYKKTGNLFKCFQADFGPGCNAFNRLCPYQIGCIIPNGEEQLSHQRLQQVFNGTESILLSDHLNTLRQQGKLL